MLVKIIDDSGNLLNMRAVTSTVIPGINNLNNWVMVTLQSSPRRNMVMRGDVNRHRMLPIMMCLRVFNKTIIGIRVTTPARKEKCWCGAVGNAWAFFICAECSVHGATNGEKVKDQQKANYNQNSSFKTLRPSSFFLHDSHHQFMLIFCWLLAKTTVGLTLPPTVAILYFIRN